MRAVLVVNPAATSTSSRTQDVIVHALAHDLDLDVHRTTHRGHAFELAVAARTDGVDVVLCLGGDGTVNEVTNGLLAAGLDGPRPVLGTVPGGSANVLSRALGLPLDQVEATGALLEAIEDKRTRRIGLGLVEWTPACTDDDTRPDAGTASHPGTESRSGTESHPGTASHPGTESRSGTASHPGTESRSGAVSDGGAVPDDGTVSDPHGWVAAHGARRYFTLNAGLGVDAAVVAAMEAQRRDGAVATPSRYLLTTLAQFFRSERRDPALTVLRPGVDPVDGVHFAFVQNAAPWTFLGPIRIDPSPLAGFDTGLDLFAARSMSVQSSLRNARRMVLRSGSATSRRLVALHDQAELTLAADRPVPLQVDGDYGGLVTSATLRAVPDALEVLC